MSRRVALFRSVLITVSVCALAFLVHTKFDRGYVLHDDTNTTEVEYIFEKASSNSTNNNFAKIESKENNAGEVDALDKSEIPGDTKSDEDDFHDDLVEPEYNYENHTSSTSIDTDFVDVKSEDEDSHDDILKNENNSVEKEANNNGDIDGNIEKEIITIDTVFAADDDNVDGYDDGITPDESTAASSDRNITLRDGKMFELVRDQLYHDSTHFTQGLTYSRSSGILYESVGLYGKSQVCQLNATTGVTIMCEVMDQQYFAEGMQVYGDAGSERLIQITWKKKTGFIYEARTLDIIQEFQFSTTKDEGWGICLDESNNEFIVSDGSAFLHFWDVNSLQEKRKIKVTRQDGNPANSLNELEFMNGKILANVWYEDVLLVIDPYTGKCEMEYDFSSLWPDHGYNVLNGISISNEDGVVYMTGKNWDRMFLVKLPHF